MSARPSPVAWIPPLLVGVSAAATAEMAIGLLLYVRAGLVAALTVVLCVQTTAFAFGLWMAPRDVGPPWLGVRRAWLLLVLAYVGGAVLAVRWETLGGLASSWGARGLGLAMLTALPLYATGLLLGAPALAKNARRTGPVAALGAAIGFAAVGVAGAGLQLAASAYVFSMTLVSAAALVHNGVLSATDHRGGNLAAHDLEPLEHGAEPEPSDRNP